MRDHLMGWAPLAQQIADSMPQAAPSKPPALMPRDPMSKVEQKQRYRLDCSETQALSSGSDDMVSLAQKRISTFKKPLGLRVTGNMDDYEIELIEDVVVGVAHKTPKLKVVRPPTREIIRLATKNAVARVTRAGVFLEFKAAYREKFKYGFEELPEDRFSEVLSWLREQGRS